MCHLHRRSTIKPSKLYTWLTTTFPKLRQTASMSSLILLVFILTSAIAVPQNFRLTVFNKQHALHEDLLLDEEENYAIVTSFAGQSDQKYLNSINFHDLITGYSVVKDVDQEKCYLQFTNHTLVEFKETVQRMQNDPNYHHELREISWTCERYPMPLELAKRIAGARITRFCRGYNIFFVHGAPTASNVGRRNIALYDSSVAAGHERQYGCGFCIFACCC